MTRHIIVTFPPCARVQDIADALALAAHSSFVWTTLDDENYVPGVSFEYKRPLRLKVHTVPADAGLARIEFTGNRGDGPKRQANYHFEFGKSGERGMYVPYDSVWLALVWAVVERLGGSVQVNEDSDKLDLEVPSQWPADPEDEDFKAMKKLIDGVRCISDADVERAQQLLDPDHPD